MVAAPDDWTRGTPVENYKITETYGHIHTSLMASNNLCATGNCLLEKCTAIIRCCPSERGDAKNSIRIGKSDSSTPLQQIIFILLSKSGRNLMCDKQL
jgi:hypothetical protein